MAEKKKGETKRQTKAGMLQKNSNQTASEKNEIESEKDPENTPKISKEEATSDNNDRPLH